MEILYALSLFLIAISIASRSHWNARGWTVAWSTLFLLAAGFRISIQFLPIAAPWIAYLFTLLAAVILVVLGRWQITRLQFLLAMPWAAAIGLVLVRSYFPACDYDSMLYHLPAIRWLQARHSFLPLQQLPGVVNLWSYIVGFEEYLSIPGIPFDLPLCGGLVQGVLKALSILTVICITPRQWPLLRYAVLYLLLIDDHFVFSSQNRSVYINISLIPIAALLVWHSWRGWRGFSESLWLSLALGTGIAAVKYHALFIALLPFAVSGFCVIHSFIKKRPIQRPNAQALYCLVAGLSLFFSVFGIHWYETGNPLTPSYFPLHPLLYRGREFLDTGYQLGSIWEAARNPFRCLIYPGILALKIIAVLWIPVTLGWLVLSLQKRTWGWNKRRLGFAVLCFMGCAVWTIIFQIIRNGESRYPRFVMGVGILGLVSLTLALPAYLQQEARRRARFAWLLGMGLFLWRLITFDTHAVNVPLKARPNWSSLVSVVKTKWQGHSSLEPTAPYLQGLIEEFIPTNLPSLQTCLQRLEQSTGLKITQGEGLLMYWTGWPYLMSAYNAMPVDYNGGGYLCFSEGQKTMYEGGFRYALVPKSLVSGVPAPPPDNFLPGPFVRHGTTGPLELIRFEEPPICESPDFKLVRLRDAT